MKILLVEDDVIFANTIKEVLIRDHYEVTICNDGLNGLIEGKKEYDLILLDVMLPYKDGFSVLKELRNTGIVTPIIMLTAKSQIDDKIEGLDAGADDYITKPFEIKELLARIKANTRRHIASKYQCQDLIVHQDQGMIENIVTHEKVGLGAKELGVLLYLIENQGQILSKEQIIQKIWGYDDESEYNNVEVYISFVRKKLAFIHTKAKITTVRSIGYKLQ